MNPVSKIAVVAVVEPLDGYRLRLTFDDGFVREVDFGGDLWGPVFEPMQDLDYFRRVRVDEETGTIVWPNGVDLDPDVLRGTFKSADRKPPTNAG